MKETTPSAVTVRFKEFLDFKLRGKFRAFCTELSIPHSWPYEKYKAGTFVLEDYMIKLMGERWPDIDTNYIQTGNGTLLKKEYKDNDTVLGLVNETDISPPSPKGPKTKTKADDLTAEITKMFFETHKAKDEVVLVHKILIRRQDDLINCKDQVIERDKEIKKVLYEYNSYLKGSSQKPAT